MEKLGLWLFPDTHISSVIATRPRSISFFEKTGIEVFANISERIGHACIEKGIAWEDFLAQIEGLEIPNRDSDWSQLPLFFLLDFLTHEHREIIRHLIPAIKNAIVAEEKCQDCAGRIRNLVREWPAFSASLETHIKEEETVLFPKILRYDYCLRHRKDDPDFSKGSARILTALNLLRNEQVQMTCIYNFLDAASYSVPDGNKNHTTGLHLVQLLETLQEKLLEHSRVEREILFPRADNLEKALYNLCISGAEG